MVLPDRIVIADREFRIEVRRSRRFAGGGRGDWQKQLITAYYWPGKTSVGEVVDTVCHEAAELLIIGRNRQFLSNVGEMLLILTHADIDALGAVVARLVRDTLAANGVVTDPTAMFDIPNGGHDGKSRNE